MCGDRTNRKQFAVDKLARMPSAPPLGDQTLALAKLMEVFEASESVANTGTGARGEGGDFEDLVLQWWNSFSDLCLAAGAERKREPGARFRKKLVWYRHIVDELTVGERRLFVPHEKIRDPSPVGTATRWLETEYLVESMVRSFPGESDAVARYAPASGPYAGQQYPGMYTGLSTCFDDVVVLVERGVLREKILLEYKTAKASRGRQIDGNAHERLSFQMMQYLEVATRYPKCTFVVLSNGAFIRYRNKYHVNFRVQADRLNAFEWFTMEQACTVAGYCSFLSGLLSWLFEGTPRDRRGEH